MALRKSSKPHSVVLQSMHFQVANLGNWLMPSSQPRGLPRRASVYEISKSTGFHMDFGFQNGFLDFKRDFWISKWISWISKWISGFQSGFLDFKLISGFQADFWISFEPLLF